MAQGYQVIKKGILDGTTDVLTLDSIPQTFTHLEFSMGGITTQASMTRGYVYIKINNTTTSIYGYLGLSRESGSISQFANLAGSGPSVDARLGAANNQANSCGNYRCILYNYTDTTLTGKTWFSESGNNDGSSSNYDVQQINAGLWLSTAAITRLDFSVYIDTGNSFKSGTSYILAGWK
jgi:hypothetical protein